MWKQGVAIRNRLVLQQWHSAVLICQSWKEKKFCIPRWFAGWCSLRVLPPWRDSAGGGNSRCALDRAGRQHARRHLFALRWQWTVGVCWILPRWEINGSKRGNVRNVPHDQLTHLEKGLKAKIIFVDGKKLAIGSRDNYIYVYDVADDGRKYTKHGRCSVSELLFSSFGQIHTKTNSTVPFSHPLVPPPPVQCGILSADKHTRVPILSAQLKGTLVGIFAHNVTVFRVTRASWRIWTGPLTANTCRAILATTKFSTVSSTDKSTAQDNFCWICSCHQMSPLCFFVGSSSSCKQVTTPSSLRNMEWATHNCTLGFNVCGKSPQWRQLVFWLHLHQNIQCSSAETLPLLFVCCRYLAGRCGWNGHQRLRAFTQTTPCCQCWWLRQS